MENNQSQSVFSNKNNFKDTFERASETVGEIGSDVRRGAEDVGEAVKQFATDAKRQVCDSQTYKKVRESARGAASKVDHQVRSNPLTSLGIAFGLGVLLSSFMRRQ